MPSSRPTPKKRRNPPKPRRSKGQPRSVKHRAFGPVLWFVSCPVFASLFSTGANPAATPEHCARHRLSGQKPPHSMDLLSPSLPFIKALQLYGWLAAPMKFFSALGSETFFLLLLPLVYWNINRSLGARLGVLLLLSVALNDLLKVAFGLPRPFWSPGVRQLAPSPETTFGFPSGHAQNTAALWTCLALQSPRRMWIAAAFALLVLIGLSRLVLGAHYPLDVVGGALIGYGILWVFMRLEAPVLAWWSGRNLVGQISVSLGGVRDFGRALLVGKRSFGGAACGNGGLRDLAPCGWRLGIRGASGGFVWAALRFVFGAAPGAF